MAVKWASVGRSLAKHLKTADALRANLTHMWRRRAEMRESALANVVRWEWYSDDYYNVDPTYFLLTWGAKQGRPLKSRGNRLNGVVGYGFDAEGKIRVAQTFWDKKPAEQYWEHHADRIRTAFFDASGCCTNTEQLHFKDGQPSICFGIGSGGRGVKLFECRNQVIVKVTQAYTDRPLDWKPKLWQYSVHELTHKSSGDVAIVTLFEDGGKETRRYKPLKGRKAVRPPVLDLRKEMSAIAATLTRAVGRFAVAQRERLKSERVSGIGLSYMYYTHGDPPYVAVHLDTRTKHEPDGVWTHEFWETMKCPHWQAFLDAHEASDCRGKVISHTRKTHELRKLKGDPMSSLVGQMLVDVLKEAKRNGIFTRLLRREACEMSVEESDGSFGWPAYAKRGPENRV